MHEPALDAAVIAELQEVLGEQFPHLCVQFAKSVQEHLLVLEAAIGIADGEALCARSHQLKGASASFGAARLSVLCCNMEAHARNSDWPAARNCLAEMRAAWQALETLLAKLTEGFNQPDADS